MKTNMHTIRTLTFFAISILMPLVALPAAEAPSKPAAPVAVRMPAFSWDTVSTAMPPRKIPPYTDEDYSRIARHSIIAGGEAMEIAGELKKFNPAVTVLGYKNLVLHVQTTADALFRDHPDWFLSSRGKPELNGKGKNKRPLYDLRRPEVREYWLQDVGRMLGDPALDGVFLDAYAKVSFGPVKRATQQDPPTDFIKAYATMMDELLKRRADTGKIVIGNYLRATSEDCQIPEVMKYLDGSYLEAFENVNSSPSDPQAYETYVARGIAAVQQVAQAGKGTIYEGGVRVCASVTWPGHIPAGAVINEPLHAVDWFPTLVKLAGGSLDQKLPLDGRDIWPVLTQGAKSPHDTLLLCGTVPSCVALRAGDWKLLLNAIEKDAEEAPADESSGNKVELYNLVTDIGEQKNLADEQPEKVKELRAQLDSVMKTAVAPGQGTTSQSKKQK